MTDISNLLDEAKARVKELTDNLPEVVDPALISQKSKIPYKAIVCREGLLWRTEEVARSACDLYDRRDVAAAIVLTRAAMENAAGTWYLMELIQAQIADGYVDDLDNKIMRLLMGDRSNEQMPDAVNVMTMLKKADASIPLLLENYGYLSEYAHPNWAGSSGLHSKIDFEKKITELGKNIGSGEHALEVGLNNLLGSLSMFGYAYNEVSGLMPKFISVCEAGLANKSKAKPDIP